MDIKDVSFYNATYFWLASPFLQLGCFCFNIFIHSQCMCVYDFLLLGRELIMSNALLQSEEPVFVILVNVIEYK